VSNLIYSDGGVYTQFVYWRLVPLI
jgi:hypothetical protein